MRIVLVMPDPPLPFGNAAARWYYVLFRGLPARGHNVTAFAAFEKPKDADEARRLFPVPRYDLRLYPYPAATGGLRAKLVSLLRPYSYMFSSDFKRDLKTELSRGFDILHLEQLWSGWVGLKYRARAIVNVHYLFSIDWEGLQPTGISAAFRQRRALAAEKALLRRYPVITSLTPRLTSRICQLAPASKVTTVPLGIESSLYPYLSSDNWPREPVVSVIGSMNWYPTYSAAVRLVARLWPGIKERVPNAELQLIGWEARKALKDFVGMRDVTIEENVPDTRPYFEKTGVLLYAPARGSGMKVKILEALAYGVPVVTTEEGIEGLPAVDGVHAGVCEDDAGLIERTVALLSQPDQRNRQRKAGRELLEQFCSPVSTLDAVEKVYQEILDKRGDTSTQSHRLAAARS